MTAPVVEDFSQGITEDAIETGPTTAHTFDLPAILAGELLVGLVAFKVDTSNDLTWPGWTRLDSLATHVDDDHLEVWYRLADGSEAATADVTSEAECQIAYQILALSHYTGLPVVGSAVRNTSVVTDTVDLPSLTSGFGAVDTLWLAVALWDNGTIGIGSYPAGYSGGQAIASGTLVDPGIGSARKTTAAASEDPGTITTAANVAWMVGTTIAIEGSSAALPDPPPPDPYVPPPPGAAVIEIRAAAPGSSRWGSALWGSGRWSPAGWQDVTPQSVSATITWGSHTPERGILADPEAGSWQISTYDPERLLDPGNPDSPYAADLRYGLPIRVRHRGTVIRTGLCETIAYAYADKVGSIRATDHQSVLANADVPDDSILADTLRARARDAIAAAGLRVVVEPDPPSGDPALAPRLESVRSVWTHVIDAARQVLHVPWIDRNGTLRFRAWNAPYDRGRGAADDELVELLAIVGARGLYSVVQARETDGDGGDLIERRLTPLPRYGARVYTRDDPTPDAGAWAEAVLADRGLQTVQWIPSAILPRDADSVERLATLEGIERFGVEDGQVTPPVDVTGILVGGTIRVTSKRDDAADWAFELELAQTRLSPLYTDTDPPQFMPNETGDGYLYPG